MSRFVSDAVVVIDLGNGESVSLRKELSFSNLEPLMGGAKRAQNNEEEALKLGLPLLRLAIISWTLKGDDGQVVEYSPDKLEKLDFSTVAELIEKATSLYFPEKKTS